MRSIADFGNLGKTPGNTPGKYGYRVSGIVAAPGFIQPQLYQMIEPRDNVRYHYLEHLLLIGEVTLDEAERIAEERRQHLDQEFDVPHRDDLMPQSRCLGGTWQGCHDGPEPDDDKACTGVDAQHTAALRTTFNEVDLSAVRPLRNQFKDVCQEQHGIKLGFMSFFVKAVVAGLKRRPELIAEIRDQSIRYRNDYDIGVAIGGGKGLVVPTLRRAELMSFAQIDLTITDFARRAADNRIAPDELVGGTFTITNGGVCGSLLSTPIVNPPQSGILGMHVIQDRPVACNGQVVIRPLMSIALAHDHRIVDGRDAVCLVKRIKEVIEEPLRMLMEI